MITRKVHVCLLENTKTHKFYDNDVDFDYSNPDFKNLYLHANYYEFEFEKFKNNHELSIAEIRKMWKLPPAAKDLACKIAKEKLEEQLAVESDREKDTKRAIELAKIVNKAEFENVRLTVIKEKNSHSKWYKNEVNSPSLYLTVVPSSVAKEAKELQIIRKKHQNDPKFNFNKTSYKTIELRVADHENKQDSDYINESLCDDWESQFDWLV